MQADMEEGCHVFQEGNAFTLEALQHKVRLYPPNLSSPIFMAHVLICLQLLTLQLFSHFQ